MPEYNINFHEAWDELEKTNSDESYYFNRAMQYFNESRQLFESMGFKQFSKDGSMRIGIKFTDIENIITKPTFNKEARNKFKNLLFCIMRSKEKRYGVKNDAWSQFNYLIQSFIKPAKVEQALLNMLQGMSPDANWTFGDNEIDSEHYLIYSGPGNRLCDLHSAIYGNVEVKSVRAAYHNYSNTNYIFIYSANYYTNTVHALLVPNDSIINYSYSDTYKIVSSSTNYFDYDNESALAWEKEQDDSAVYEEQHIFEKLSSKGIDFVIEPTIITPGMLYNF